jgi:hypothetical protein
MMVFEDTELHTLGNAFDRAWDRFLRTGRLTPDNFAQSREMIANAILECARRGERDEWRLARHAFFGLCELKFPGTPLRSSEREGL